MVVGMVFAAVLLKPPPSICGINEGRSALGPGIHTLLPWGALNKRRRTMLDYFCAVTHCGRDDKRGSDVGDTQFGLFS